MPSSVNVLLVEDNPADAELIREVLAAKESHIRLATVADGAEAMSFLKQEGEYANMPRPDLVLLDLDLPRQDGREILKKIRFSETFKDLPVVVLTTSQSEQDIAMCYALGANRYFPKPLDLYQFREIIEAIENYWECISQPSAS